MEIGPEKPILLQPEIKDLSAPFYGFERDPETGIILTSLDTVYNWARRWSLWPLGFALACCGIEMMGVLMPRFDLARFGAEVMRASPRQADMMFVAGTVTKKMAPAVKRLYDQMGEPKYVISMGACANAGGPFVGSYSVVMGVDKIIPVDVYLPGCPPRPEALLDAVIALQKRIDKQSYFKVRKGYSEVATR